VFIGFVICVYCVCYASVGVPDLLAKEMRDKSGIEGEEMNSQNTNFANVKL